ncbi:hypothetical protein [Stenotrophomonas phage BUCT608]|nr:hypothetical protein [Stenotrophomonas phage BUCT608]QYC97372.1 hypothetical protein [Stenotrophomonas phage BUCT608]
MFSIPRGYRQCTGAWWLVGTYSNITNGALIKRQIIVDNGGDDWYRSTNVATLEVDHEASHAAGEPILRASTESGSLYHLPLSKMKQSDQLELIQKHSAPQAKIFDPYAQECQVKRLMGLDDDFDLNDLVPEPKPLTRDDLLRLAREVSAELEKINKMYRDMFLKAGIDLETMKRIA